MHEDAVARIMREKFAPFGFTSHQYPNAIGLWPNEQESLLWLALNAPDGNHLEIGSFCGGSAVLMCLARRFLGSGPAVVSVDRTFDGWGGAFNRNLYRIGKFQDLSVKIECDSALLPDNYDGAPVGLAFIDGWHSFKAALRDFDSVDPWVVPGGFVAFHDVSPQPYQPGQIDHFHRRAVENFDAWTAEPLEVWRGDREVGDYHRSEAEQDFLLDEAVAYVIKERGYELVDIPVLDGSTHFDRAPVYRHGSTSPYHGLVALRKPNHA